MIYNNNGEALSMATVKVKNTSDSSMLIKDCEIISIQAMMLLYNM